MNRLIKTSLIALSMLCFQLAGNVTFAQPPDGGGGSGSGGASTTYDFGTDIGGLWQYNSDADVYYIVGLMYCSSPADDTYEQMGIYVPAAYMNATANSDGTYTCTLNSSGTVNGYTASTAPIVFPVNTSGYSAQSAPSGWSSSIADYTSAGFVYLWAGCRGRDHGAPLGVTDMKAAIRYFRYLQATQGDLPGSSSRIFTFGHSGGGAQSSLMGTSGNNSLYDDYLTAIGAASGYTDDVCGSMCWCPITNLDLGDASYEWNMGLTRSSLSSADQSISEGLAAVYAEYINAIGFVHPTSGTTLTLSATSDGYYQSGSYYEYIMEVINDAVSRYNSYNSASVSSYSTTDESALSTFCSSYKSATKGLGAFDDYDAKGQAENTLFGISGTAGHFDKYLAELVNEYASDYYSSFTSDLAESNTDAVGRTVEERLMMYTPLYYLIDNSTYYNGGGTSSSTVAPYWRIRSGITQGDAALCAEVNLALALEAYDGVESVDFETIWGQGHTEAEDSGDATDNFISWVEECCTSGGGGGSTTGINAAEAPARLRLYPNPAQSTMTIEAEGAVSIYDNAGRLIKVVESSNGHATVDVRSMAKGIYHARCGKASTQFVVE